MSKIYGLYNDDDLLVSGAKELVSKGVFVEDVFSPFPVHGIEKIIGMKWTNLAIAAFIYGCLGLSVALAGLWFFMIKDWPMDIGGKPNWTLYHNLPAFIPVCFEFTVFCTAHGMALTYFLRNWLFPGVTARNPHPKTTDDHFAIEIDPKHNDKFNLDEITSMLKSSGAIEVFQK